MAKRKFTMQEYKKWIRKQIDYYAPILGVNLNSIRLEQRDGEDEYISISCTYPYLDPTIFYSKESFINWKKGKLKKDRILHELCHIITDPLYCVALDRYVSKTTINNERERLTDIITSIIRNLEK